MFGTEDTITYNPEIHVNNVTPEMFYRPKTKF